MANVAHLPIVHGRDATRGVDTAHWLRNLKKTRQRPSMCTCPRNLRVQAASCRQPSSIPDDSPPRTPRSCRLLKIGWNDRVRQHTANVNADAAKRTIVESGCIGGASSSASARAHVRVRCRFANDGGHRFVVAHRVALLIQLQCAHAIKQQQQQCSATVRTRCPTPCTETAEHCALGG